MANATLPLIQTGEARDGNNPAMLQKLRGGLDHDLHAWQPSFAWVCPITHDDLEGANASQTSTITIPAAGFVSGRLTVTFSGDAITTPVVVTADAASGDANTDLAAALESAIATARAGDLAGIVSDESVATNVVTIEYVEGIGMVHMAIVYDRAQVIEAQFSGTIYDGDYTYRFTGGGLGAPVDVSVLRSTTPATIADMIAAVEAAIEAEAGLSAVVVSADDDTVDLNSIQMVEGLDDVVITMVNVVPQTFTTTFGGTATDGNYDLIFDHASLPGPVTVRVNRSGGVPATNTDLAAAMETAVEAHGALAALIDGTASSDSGAVYTIVTYPGVTGLTITSAAPSPGTLVVSETTCTVTVSDATPAGPAITQNTTIRLDLNDICPWGFPGKVIREEVILEVTETFGANRTFAAGDANAPAGLIGGTPISLNAVAITPHAAADTEYEHRPEHALVPIADVVLGSSTVLTQGECTYTIVFSPDLEAGSL